MVLQITLFSASQKTDFQGVLGQPPLPLVFLWVSAAGGTKRLQGG